MGVDGSLSSLGPSWGGERNRGGRRGQVSGDGYRVEWTKGPFGFGPPGPRGKRGLPGPFRWCACRGRTSNLSRPVPSVPRGTVRSCNSIPQGVRDHVNSLQTLDPDPLQ